jgi:putative endonuclease
MKTFWVYILECSDHSYYVGFTSKLEYRVWQHQTGFFPKCYTYNRRPVVLVYSLEFYRAMPGIRFEKQVKGWSRKKKEALIKGDLDLLKILAECNNASSHKNFKKGSKSSGA